MNSTTVLQCQAIPTVVCHSEAECIALALANPGNVAYLVWVSVTVLTPAAA